MSWSCCINKLGKSATPLTLPQLIVLQEEVRRALLQRLHDHVRESGDTRVDCNFNVEGIPIYALRLKALPPTQPHGRVGFELIAWTGLPSRRRQPLDEFSTESLVQLIQHLNLT